MKKSNGWNKLPRNKKIKNSIALASGILLASGAIAGIALSSTNIAHNISVDSDFEAGRNFQINLSLTNSDGTYIQDIDEENKLLKESSSYLVKLLEAKGLTNIKVNYGFEYQTLPNNSSTKVQVDPNAKNPNPEIINDKKVERFGTLIATFNNDGSTLGLNDVKDEVNKFYNDNVIYDTFTKSNKYTLEVIPSSGLYNGLPSNGRWQDVNANDDALFVEKNPDGTYSIPELKTFFSLVNDPSNYDGEIKPYKDKDGNDSLSKVDIKAKNIYNVGPFANDLNNFNVVKAAQDENSSATTTQTNDWVSDDYNLLADASSSTDGSTPPADGTTPPADGSGDEQQPTEPSPTDQFQTTATWVLWNDKEGLINYLNKLIISWYLNLYANIPFSFDEKTNTPKVDISDQTIKNLNKDNINSILFDTADYNYDNYVDVNIRNQINTYINSLTDVQKEFMAFCAVGLAGSDYGGSMWHPVLITDQTLIPTLYEFYTSSYSGYTEPDPNLSSPSEINGWGWIESDATANPVRDLVGNYLVAFIDYRNFQDYFVNPNPPDTSAPDYKETDPIEPYYINDLLLSNPNYNATDFSDVLTNDFYHFPIRLFNQQAFVDDWPLFEQKFVELGQNFPKNSSDDQVYNDYYDQCAALANEYIHPSVIFSYQYMSQPTIITSYGGMSSLNILFIIISVLIFLIGVFISIRYRIPGFISFLLTGLTYVLSIVIYNALGFNFSFFTLIASTVNAFLSFMLSVLFCRNTFKAIKESLNIAGAIINSIKKYWRLSLDINAVLILSSLAFLFFGEINNINIGAILIISVFLSFILNGILYYILMLFYVVVLDMSYENLFVSTKQYKWLLNLDNSFKKSKFYWFLDKTFINVNYFSKWSYLSVGLIAVVMIAGTVILFVINPLTSVDFTASNIIFVRNFDTLGLTQAQVINLLNVSSFNNYVYNNQMVIYTLNHLDPATFANSLANNPLLLANTSLTYLSSEVSNQLVANTLKCLGIAIGFSAVWYLVSLNIASVLPIAFSQFCFALLFLGMTGITRVPFDINSIAVLIFMFMIVTASTILFVSQMKHNWNKHEVMTIKDFKALIVTGAAKINSVQILTFSFVLIFAIFSAIFVSNSLTYVFVLLVIVAVVSILVNNLFIAISWYWSNRLMNKFTNKLSVIEQPHMKFEYDAVNEQPVRNLNC